MNEPTPPPLSRLQRRAFTIYLDYHDRPMTVPGLFWANRRGYLLTFLVFGAIIPLFYFFVSPNTATVFAAVLVTMLLRDYGVMRRSAQVWPALREVINWQQVAERLDSK